MEREFVDKETGLLGSAYDADSDVEEGKYYIYSYFRNLSILLFIELALMEKFALAGFSDCFHLNFQMAINLLVNKSDCNSKAFRAFKALKTYKIKLRMVN